MAKVVRPRRESAVSRLLTGGGAPSMDQEWLRIALDEVLENEQPLWKPPTRYFRASVAGDACLRAIVLESMGHNIPVEARKRRIFRTGTKIEEVNVEAARAAGIFVEPDDVDEGGQPVVRYEDPPIIGHIDMLARRPADGKVILVEYKSINESLFQKLPKEHGPTLVGESPLLRSHTRYAHQWNTYAGAPNLDLDEGCIVFEAKNTQKQRFFWLLRDDDLLDEVLGRLRPAAPYILSDPQRVPPRGLDPYEARDEDGSHKNCSRRYLCRRLPEDGCTYDEVRRIDAQLRG